MMVGISLSLISIMFVLVGMVRFQSAQATALHQLRAELHGMLQSVAGADAHRYNAMDSAGRSMDTAKIIADPSGGYLAVYHTYIDNIFRVSVASSVDLIHWTFRRELGDHASQPYITALSNGGFVVAWEADPRNHIVFRYYASRDDLFHGVPARSYDTQQTLSPCAEGTPVIYTVQLNPDIDHSTIDVGGHFYSQCDRDREMRGTLTNFSQWIAVPQPIFDHALLAWGVKGNIGDRDAAFFKGFQFGVIEGQYIKGDFGSWRCFLFDYSTGTAQPLDIQTNGGSQSFGNPTITSLIAPNGQPAIVITVYIFGDYASSGESGELIYYKKSP